MTFKDIYSALKNAPISNYKLILLVIILLSFATLEFVFVVCIALLLGEEGAFLSTKNIPISAPIIFIIIALFYRLFFQLYMTSFSKNLSQQLGAQIFSHQLDNIGKSVTTTKLNDWINLQVVKVNILTYDFYVPVSNILSSVMSLCLVLLGLQFTVGTTILYVFIPIVILYFSVNYFSKGKITSNAEMISISNSGIIRTIRDVFRNKELIALTRTSQNFKNQFQRDNTRLRSSQASNLFLYQLPRLLIEPLVFIAIIYLLSADRIDSETMLITLFGIARMTGPLQLIVASLATIRSAAPSLRDILPLLVEPMNNDQRRRQLAAPFNKFHLEATVDGFVFESSSGDYSKKLSIRSGEWHKLNAPSGVGKTSFIENFLGFDHRFPSTTVLNGRITTAIKDELRLIYVKQNSVVFEGTIKNNISLYSQKPDTSLILDSLKIVGFDDYPLADLEYSLDDGGANISGGQMQRMVIARALHFLPNLLILDEATSALDKDTEETILANIKSTFKHMAVIFIAHNQNYEFSFDRQSKLKRKPRE